jgi:hypothetical protein
VNPLVEVQAANNYSLVSTQNSFCQSNFDASLHTLHGVARVDVWNRKIAIDFLEEKQHMYISIPCRIFLGLSTVSLNSLEGDYSLFLDMVNLNMLQDF